MGAILVLIFVGFLWLVVKAASAGGLQQDINLLHSRLASLARDLSELRRENEALRRELVAGGSLPEDWAPPPPVETEAALQAYPAGAAGAGTAAARGPVVVGSAENPAVAFRVRRAIIDLPEASGYAHQLRASIKAGQVTLEGTVPSAADGLIIERAVYSALGVTSVENLLQTGPYVPAPAASPAQPTAQPKPVAQPVEAAPSQSALTVRPAVPALPAQPLEPPSPPRPSQPSVPAVAQKARPSAPRRSPKLRIARPAVNWSRAWAAIAGPLGAAAPAYGGRGTTGAPGEAESQVSRAEAAVGVIWLSRVGVILLIVGAIFAYRYGVTNDYLRTALGYLAGLAVLGLGWWGHRSHYRIWSQAMTGGGIAILYLSTTAATVLFDRPVMPYGVGFGLMVLTTVLATGLAVAYDSMVVGLFGLIGGFATPFLLSTGSGGGGFGGLFAYIAVLDAGLLLVAYFRRWPLFNYIVSATTWGIYGLWRVSRFETGLASTGMWAATTYHLIFALLSIAHTVMRRKKGTPAELALATLNGFAYFACGLDLLAPQLATARGAFAVGLAGFYLVLGAMNYRLNRKDRLMTMALLGLSWVFGTAAVPVALDGSWITVAWAVEGATLVWLGSRVPVQHVDTAGLTVFGLAVARLVSIDSFPATFGLPLEGAALRAVTFAAVIGSAYAAAWAITVAGRRLKPKPDGDPHRTLPGPGDLAVRDALGAIGCVLTVWFMTREVLLYYSLPGQVGSVVMALASLWGLYGLLLAGADLRLRHRLVRMGARAVLAGAVVFVAAGPPLVTGGFSPVTYPVTVLAAVPRYLIYLGTALGLGTAWVAEYSFRRRQADPRANGLLSLVAAVVGFWVAGAHVAREVRVDFMMIHSRPATGWLGVQLASTIAYWVAACLGVYSSAVMYVSGRLGSRSGRALAGGLMVAAMAWAAVAAVPVPAVSPALRAVAFVLVVQTGALALRRPAAAAAAGTTRHWWLTAVAMGSVALTAWWGAVEVLFAFARSTGAEASTILMRRGAFGAGMATGSGAYGLVAWLGAYALLVRWAGIRARCAQTRWTATGLQGLGLLILLGVVVGRTGSWAWQGLAFVAAVIGAYASDWLLRRRGGEVAEHAGAPGILRLELAAARVASLAACAITLVWMVFSVARQFDLALVEPGADRLAVMAACNHWILITAGLYGLAVLLAGLRFRTGDFRAMGLGTLALSVIGVFSVGLLNTATGHALRFAAYATTVGGLYAATYLVRRFGGVSTVRERAATHWASLAAAAGSVAWLTVQVSRFFAPVLAVGTEAQQAFARTTMDFAVSAAWGIYGLAVLLVGFALRHRWTRVLGLAIFVLTLGKIVASDMWLLAFRWRIWITVGVGIIFVAASLLYQRYIKLILLDDD